MGEFDKGEARMTEKFWESFWRICQLELHDLSLSNLVLGILCVAVVVHCAAIIYVKVKHKTIQFSTELLIILLISYMVFIAEASIFSRTVGSQPRVFDTKHLWIDAKVYQNMTNLLNAVMFVPYGALISGVMERRKASYRVVMTVMYCFLTSLFVECVQYTTGRGYFEIDDLEANVLGGVLGSVFVCLCTAIGKMIDRKKTAYEK